jgi:hypothetical protein
MLGRKTLRNYKMFETRSAIIWHLGFLSCVRFTHSAVSLQIWKHSSVEPADIGPGRRVDWSRYISKSVSVRIIRSGLHRHRQARPPDRQPADCCLPNKVQLDIFGMPYRSFAHRSTGQRHYWRLDRSIVSNPSDVLTLCEALGTTYGHSLPRLCMNREYPTQRLLIGRRRKW